MSIPVNVGEDVTGRGIFSAEFDVTFDPAVVVLDDTDDTGTLSSDCNVFINPTSGRISIAITCTSALEGSAPLIFLQGQAQGAGQSALSFDGFQFNEGDPGATTTDGSITVVAGDPPEANDDSETTLRNTAVEIDVLANDSDPEGGDLTITTVSDPANGTTAIDDNGTPGDPTDDTITYTPDTDFTGTDIFTYTIEDPPGNSDQATVTVTVNNAPPEANDDDVTTDEDNAVEIDVLDNDTDDTGPLTVTGTSDPANGTATVINSGTGATQVEYTPDTDFNGTDSFTYTVEDPEGATDQATVTVTVNPVNDPPVANDDAVSTDEDTPVEIDVLANDTDDGTISVTSVSDPAEGTATIINNGSGATQVEYTPDAEFSGIDTFTYTIEDDNGETDQATVTVTVNAVNDPPEADDDAATTTEDTSVAIDVLDNDSDPEGNTLTVISVSTPSDGSATIINGGSQVEYDPDPDFNGTDTFTYTVSDGAGGTAQASVTVTVTPVQDPPVVANPIPDRQLVLGGSPFTEDLTNVFDDPDGDALSFSATSDDQTVATATVDGSILTVTAVGLGSTTITVTADDGLNASGKAAGTAQDAFAVTVVASGNQAPIVVNPINDQSVDGDPTPLTFDLGPVFDDPDGDPLSYQALSTNRSVATTSVSGATLTVTPAGNGETDVIVTALDPDGASAQDVFSLTASSITVQTETFEATLSGAHEVPANASRATGTVTATLQEGTLTVTGSFEGLESPFNPAIGGGAHLHLGYFGQNGPVEIPLVASVSGDGLSGSFAAADNTFDLTAAQIEALRARQLYVNIHTEALPPGEIRGQLLPALENADEEDGDAVYRSILSGRAETTPNTSPGVGGVLVERRGDQLIATGAFSGLESDVATDIGIHIHEAGLGLDGEVVFPLTFALGGDDRSGTVAASENTFTLTSAQQTALEEGDYYVNVHTEAYPAGELRGQILPFTQRVFEAYLAGMNEVPPVMTAGMGGALLVYDTETSDLTVSGAFSGLESDFATDIGAHIHEAGPAANGGVIFPLAVTVGDNDRSGSFPAADNVFTLDTGQTDALFGGQYYVNVHSADNQAGEVRGQILASTNVAPTAPEITTPTDGASVTIGGDPATPFGAEWTAASDANGNEVVYRWQLALDAGFATVLVDTVVTETSFTTTFGAVGTLLTANGVDVGEDVTLYHRAIASDGSFQTAGPGAAVTLTRDALTADDPAAAVPAGFRLQSIYPNPFNPRATVVFDLSERATVEVEVLDLLGRQVLVLPARPVAPGTGHRIALDASDLASGTYLVRLVAETDAQTLVQTQSITLVK